MCRLGLRGIVRETLDLTLPIGEAGGRICCLTPVCACERERDVAQMWVSEPSVRPSVLRSPRRELSSFTLNMSTERATRNSIYTTHGAVTCCLIEMCERDARTRCYHYHIIDFCFPARYHECLIFLICPKNDILTLHGLPVPLPHRPCLTFHNQYEQRAVS